MCLYVLFFYKFILMKMKKKGKTTSMQGIRSALQRCGRVLACVHSVCQRPCTVVHTKYVL